MDIEPSRLKSLLRALALYAEARGRLLQIEAREAGAHLAAVMMAAALTAGSLLAGWLLALPALVWLLAEGISRPWWQVALAVAGLHFLAALAGAVFLALRLRRMTVFDETFRQFQKDREWISGSHDPQ
ncbi:MAG TPA: phage holin family protein [Prosthecobacter sp.]|nr:phage holin family protein [Prosthecobacter sp.]HRK16320.1 phage holin family protein [Prosthecobacter sp.]